jgi:hypothetical protein
VFGPSSYRPGSFSGRHLLAHELAHVLQRRTEGGQAPMVQRKILVRGPTEWLFFHGWHELGKRERDAFLASRFPGDGLARRVVEDMADAGDRFEFEDMAELHTEVFKRVDTSRLMRQSQKDLGPLGKAFGYPDHTAKGCGPRVSRAAQKFWGPVQSRGGSYFFELSPAGKQNAYQALTTLFTPQVKKCDRTLIHCDYLPSVVHFRVFAETIGVKTFNDRVAHDTIEVTLKWNGFADIEPAFLCSSKRVSLQEVRPSSERDLVIGDHVVFWNQRAYDLIKERGDAWRLENAVLVDKKRGTDIFLGHGSGEQTDEGMPRTLASRYNEVVKRIFGLIEKTRQAASGLAALRDLGARFPNITQVGAEWRIQGFHFRSFNERLEPIKSSDRELVGLRDPEDPGRMNEVKRPIESA